MFCIQKSQQGLLSEYVFAHVLGLGMPCFSRPVPDVIKEKEAPHFVS